MSTLYNLMPHYGDFTFSPPAVPKFYFDAYSQEQRIKRICEEIVMLVEYSNKQTDEMNEYTTGLEEVRSAFEDLQADYRQFRTGLEAKYTEFENVFNTLKSQVDQTVKEIEQKQQALDTKINNYLKQWKSELNTFETKLNTALSQYRQELNEFNQRQSQFENKQQQLENKQGELESEQNKLEAEMANLKNEWQNKETELNQLFKKLSDELTKKQNKTLADLKAQQVKTLNQLKAEVERLDKTQRNKFDQLDKDIRAKIDSQIGSQVLDVKTYSDAQDAVLYLRIYAIIRELQEEVEAAGYNPQVKDPTSTGGELRDVASTLNEIYEWLRYYGLTARGQFYYSGYWTASDCDNLGLSAREYDTGAYFYFSRKQWKYEYSPVTGRWQETQRNIADLATLAGDNWNAEGWDTQEWTVQDIENNNWDCFYTDFYNYTGNLYAKFKRETEEEQAQQNAKLGTIETKNQEQDTAISGLDTRVTVLEQG